MLLYHRPVHSNGALDFVASHPTIVALCTRRHRVPTSDALVSGQHPSVNQDGTRANRGAGTIQAGVVKESGDPEGTTGAASMTIRASWFLCHDTKAIVLTSVPPRVLSHVQHSTSDCVVCSNQRGPHHPRQAPRIQAAIDPDLQDQTGALLHLCMSGVTGSCQLFSWDGDFFSVHGYIWSMVPGSTRSAPCDFLRVCCIYRGLLTHIPSI